MEEKKPEGEKHERKIPVFTVLKNSAILKNIFLINKSPLPSLSIGKEENLHQETEEILTVGRHPDCNIVFMHPSISRFHLQINTKPSSLKLLVTDLFSVHGTWVSGKKIESGLRVELNEGDTIRVGGSTRVYRLHWVPLSRAYDMENPFISESDVAMLKENEKENLVLEEENDVEMSQDESSLAAESKPVQVEVSQAENSLATEIKLAEEKETLAMTVKEEGRCYHQGMNSIPIESGEIQSLDSILEYIASLFSDEKWGLIAKREIPSETSVPDENMSSFYDAKEDIDSTFRNDFEVTEILSTTNTESRSQQFSENNLSPEYYSVKQDLPEIDSSLSSAEVKAHSASEMIEATENKSSMGKDHEQMNICAQGIEPVNLSVPAGDISNSRQINEDNQTPEPPVASQPLSEESQENFTANMLVSLKSAGSGGHAVTENLEEVENRSLSRNIYDKSICSVLLEAESVNSSLPVGGDLSEIIDSQKCETPESVFASIENQENLLSSCVRSDIKLSSSNIWSRRGKPDAALQLQTSRSRGKTRGADTEWENEESVGSISIAKNLFQGLRSMEEEILTPGKENYSSNTLLLKSLKKRGKRGEKQICNSCRAPSSKIVFSSSKHAEEDLIVSSDKENQIPKVLQQRKSESSASKNHVKFVKGVALKERKAEREPLQSLLMNFSGYSISEASVPSDATRSINSVSSYQTLQKCNFVREERKSWTMVADTTSLLDSESRKSLQLLQGLKGTRLVIPKMVITELYCMKRRGSLFRRKTEASFVLEWIEECIVSTKWWIHVQNSVEEGRPIAPTPPGSPQCRFSPGSDGLPCETTSSIPFSACGSLLEIVSPTAEDYILDCAVSYRKVNNNGQLVLLSNDVTLKIKAMAEGLMCETAEEFRYSLVNPFSERFLWADSSPRGRTWNVFDDLVLKERYYHRPSNKSSKGESTKGLKLILLHNSHCGQISQSVS